MKKPPPPQPPHPHFIRRPSGPFGWLEDRLLKEHWLQDLGPDATAVLLFFALAADRHGASYWSRGRIATELGIDLQTLHQALQRLIQLRLVAHRPWCKGHVDGVWQLLDLPGRESR